MKKIILAVCLILVSVFAFAQASERSDEMSQPEIDNLSGAKPDGDDLSPESGVTSYTANGDEPLVMDKPEDDDPFNPVKGNIDQLQPTDLSTATVYPNPANDYIIVNSEASTGYIRILNLLGQEMMAIPITSEESYINIADLDEGIYFVSIEAGAQKIVKKIKVLN